MLGPSSSIEAALEALLVQHGERGEFEPYDPPAPETAGRVDLRDLLAFTIDPETAKDFDDAISVREEAGGVRAWVHIADVSFFVPAGSPLDRGAARRATSVYVPGRVAPMLPPDLADDLCSLRPHLDRLCVTVEFPPDQEPLFYRSVIRSGARLTYGQAQRREAEPQVAQALEVADRMTAELRRRRFERGALRIESPELAFAFDGRGGVQRAWFESEPEAHRIVEELMIVANEAVASLLATRRREALFRIHERPDPVAVNLLLAKLAALEVPTPPAPEAETLSSAEAERVSAAAAEQVMDYVKRSDRGKEAFPALVLRSLKQARYDPRNLGHSGLASRAYCHFTSPIRRYPDLVCHRALLHELGVGDATPPDELAELAEHTSAREREAAGLEYLADELCLAWLLEAALFERGWEEPFEGEVIGLIASGLFVRFGEVFEGFLPVRRLADDYFELDPLATALVGRSTGRRHRLGDSIHVRVEDIRRTEGKVELAPASGAARSGGSRSRRSGG